MPIFLEALFRYLQCVCSRYGYEKAALLGRGIANRKQVKGPQHNMLTIANVKQDIESILKWDKVRGLWPPLAPL